MRLSTVYIPVRTAHEEGTEQGVSAPVQRPFAGSHWSHTPNTSWSTSPSQKIAITQMIVPNMRTARSMGLSRFEPPRTPSGIPTRDATAIPPMAISNVAGKRVEIWVHTDWPRSEEHTSELQSRLHLVCRLLLEKKKK